MGKLYSNQAALVGRRVSLLYHLRVSADVLVPEGVVGLVLQYDAAEGLYDVDFGSPWGVTRCARREIVPVQAAESGFSPLGSALDSEVA